MPYELRLGGETRTFETEEDAVACARDLIRANADAQPEIRDLSTGHAVAPGATAKSRDELANKVGF
ncbi:MAG: hypothetical protein BGO51_07425 [Rhodospirillales bacterium 69-11]|jgi:hypothetical protein|nr:hypothetical protein [Rhodospirillales bacterium]MBN8925190.1 hypothetical protein [Rhodospirillales bacterium]OJW24223.1 MAG: hypothetical protein BGO51_07425 [Rhodospirillales bacterium 69-11]